MAEFAVPIFLMISGFYAFSHSDDSCGKIIRRTKRIGLVTLYSITVYFIYSVFIYHKLQVRDYIESLLSFKNILKVIVLHDLDSIHGGPLWFLPALLYCYLFQITIEKYNIHKYAFRLIPILCVSHIIVSIYSDSKYIHWHFKSNFWISGLFWFLVGNYIAYKKARIINNLPKNYLLYFIVFITGLAAVILNLYTPNFSKIAIVIYATFLFLLAIKNSTTNINKAVEFIGDKLSLNIYILHTIIAKVLSTLLNRLDFAQDNIYLVIKPLFVVLISLLISWMIYKIDYYRLLFANKG